MDLPMDLMDRLGHPPSPLRLLLARNRTGQNPAAPIRFVLFSTGRCGKPILLELLGGAGGVVCDRRLLAQRCYFPLHFLHRRSQQAQTRLWGFQLTSQDLIEAQGLSEPSRFLKLLHQQGYHIIHLHRQDIMRQAIASIKAQQSVAAPRLKRQPIEVAPAVLLAQLAHLEQQRLEATAIVSAVPHLRIVYETDLLDPNRHLQTAQRLSNFLAAGSGLAAPARPIIRLVHQQLSDLVANYDEIVKTLEQSDYAYVLSPRSLHLVI